MFFTNPRPSISHWHQLYKNLALVCVAAALNWGTRKNQLIAEVLSLLGAPPGKQKKNPLALKTWALVGMGWGLAREGTREEG